MREETLSRLQVPAFHIGVMSDVLERAGLNPGPALETIGLNPVARLPSSGFVSARGEIDFERQFLAMTPGRRDLWLEVGRRHRLYAYGAFGLALGTSPSHRDWVAVSIKARDLFFTFAEYLPVNRKGELCGIEFRLDSVPTDIREMTLYRDLGAASSIVSEIWGGSADSFRLELAAPRSVAGFVTSVFPFQVLFDAPKTGLTWPPGFTDVPLPNGSYYLHRYYLAQCAAVLDQIPGSDIEAAISRVIMMKPSAYGKVEAVARRLNMSVRTLQRRLNTAGVTFRAILSRVHAEVAKMHLRGSTLSIAQIAAHLGYADRTSFDVAFCRWTGVSPRKFRDSMLLAE